MAGTITVTATNFNGTLDEFLYLVLGLGNDVAEKGIAHVIRDIAKMKQLDYMVSDEDPMEDYVEGDPTFGNNTVKDKRDLTVDPWTVSGKIVPFDWLPVWEKYRSQGSITQLRENPNLLADVLLLVKNTINRQIAKLYWQGDKLAGGASPLRFTDGVILRIEAVGSGVVNVPPTGVITQANVFDKLTAFWQGMTQIQKDDPDFKILMYSGDWDKATLANTDVKSTTVGFLNQADRKEFMGKEIITQSFIPENHIIGAVVSPGPKSNLVMGFWFDPDQEFNTIQVDRITNFGKAIGYRVDGTIGTQFRYGPDMLYYKPV